MNALTYVRLIGFTAGTLLMLFWMVVILGYRRQRNFERVFFFCCLALFFFYSGSLLALNAQIYYPIQPLPLSTFAFALIAIGLSFLPGLIAHLHLEYLETRNQMQWLTRKKVQLAFLYAPVIYFALRLYPILSSGNGFDFLQPGKTLGEFYGYMFSMSLLYCCVWEVALLRKSPQPAEKFFHGMTASLIAIAALLVLFLHAGRKHVTPEIAGQASTILALLPILPLGILIYLVHKHNFLQIGRQKNLVYAICVTFFALLYLSLVRRVSAWLEPALPPEASAAVLVFVLVVFFEPLQRMLSRSLRQTAQGEVDRTQRLLTQIQETASQGDLQGLRTSIEKSVKQQLELATAQLFLDSEKTSIPLDADAIDITTSFPIHRGERQLGRLDVQPYGGMISGETSAALEFLCEQLPAAIDLCRAVGEKLQLERELAERERLALLGQTAASISHNLKNPLGSIKTILQVQLENPEMPDSMRGETKMVLEEISRLSSKLNQLLQFSRPAIRGSEVPFVSDAAAVLREVVEVLRPEADRRGVSLRLTEPNNSIPVAVSPEALNDILSNLTVNALEATSSSGAVSASMQLANGSCLITIEDDGPGISPAAREKILQPFFTTKSQGTGLGLAIVARRVSEFAGKLEFESPINGNKGTRFQITLPLVREVS
jgi:signal transduction histidine kinase